VKGGTVDFAVLVASRVTSLSCLLAITCFLVAMSRPYQQVTIFKGPLMDLAAEISTSMVLVTLSPLFLSSYLSSAFFFSGRTVLSVARRETWAVDLCNWAGWS
jgi:hypothetical protein